MPDVDDTNQYKLYVARRRLKDLLDKMFDMSDTTKPVYLGKARALVAPQDSSAYPSEVLSRDVIGNYWLPEESNAAGIYRLLNPGSVHISPRYNPDAYNTLLHELGHARGHDFFRNFLKRNRIKAARDSLDQYNYSRDLGPLSEQYAQDLADSILKTKPTKYTGY